MDLIARIQARETRAIARALTLVENGDATFLTALDAEYASLPRPERFGITGPPGSGKSTLTSALIGELRKQRKRVGVVAVDPSSPFSGGALLGDRLRMGEHTLDADVFMRSMASRGRFGGLAIGSEDACEVLALGGFDSIIVETVGVGQSEVDIARMADTTVVVLTPSAGDSVQALKAGIMQRGFNLVSPADPMRHGALITVRSHKVDLLVKWLAEDQIVVSSRDNNLRISPHFYNNLDDIQRLLDALSKHKALLV